MAAGDPTVVPFPKTAAPGRLPGEGTGDLVNVFAGQNADEVVEWRRVPGIKPFSVLGSPLFGIADQTPRGLFGSSGLLISGWEGGVVGHDSAGVGTPYIGTIAGQDPMTFARNNRLPVPDVAMVCQAGAFLLHPDTNTVTAYSAIEPDVGAPNSVSYFNGYFMFTYGNGKIAASDLQSTAIDPLSYANAEANPDGLYRGVVVGQTWLAMGPQTIEVWQAAGQNILPNGTISPFPLSRTTVIPTGLIGPWAVAGGGADWDRPVIFVASDYTVRQLDGYKPAIISTMDISRDIYGQRSNPSGLRACLYVHGQNAIWVLNCPDWTWCYNVTTQCWHKRQSYLQSGWRIRWSAQAYEKWLGQDLLTHTIHEITSDANDEAGQPLIARARSGPVKQFPTGVRVPAVFFDFTVGLGSVTGSDTIGVETPGTNPTVMISWSHDGGASWANPLRRTFGRQGEYQDLVRVNNLGRSSHHGVRMEWVVNDPVPFCFRGAVLPEIAPRRPSQVHGASLIAGA